MSEINIFDLVDYETTRDYFKFENVGDKIQGTYIARDDNSVDGYHNPQTLVSLLQTDGNVKTVSIRHNKTGLLEELDKVTLGQIIGFTFTGTKDNPGKQATKFIRIVHDPKYVDEAWLVEHKKVEAARNNPTAGMTVEQIFPTPVAPVAPVTPVTTTESLEASLAESLVATAPVMSDSDKIKEIANLAKVKLSANGTEEVKAKILESTGLEFTTANLDAILTKLQAI